MYNNPKAEISYSESSFIHSAGEENTGGFRDCGNESLGVMSSSFSSGGATFIFPNTSVYPEATQRISTRPGMNNEHFFVCCDLAHLISWNISFFFSFSCHKYEALFWTHTLYTYITYMYVYIIV